MRVLDQSFQLEDGSDFDDSCMAILGKSNCPCLDIGGTTLKHSSLTNSFFFLIVDGSARKIQIPVESCERGGNQAGVALADFCR